MIEVIIHVAELVKLNWGLLAVKGEMLHHEGVHFTGKLALFLYYDKFTISWCSVQVMREMSNFCSEMSPVGPWRWFE
jgi:hypothetical protein